VGGSFLRREASPYLCFVSYLQCGLKCVRGRAGRAPPRCAIIELGVSCSCSNVERKTGGALYVGLGVGWLGQWSPQPLPAIPCKVVAKGPRVDSPPPPSFLTLFFFFSFLLPFFSYDSLRLSLSLLVLIYRSFAFSFYISFL